ncbi:hypothetical protein PFICI_00494 [Pestalotiopsis fici W106-1]|uniref:FAD-binding PCMH-type domain-containing protein n=1 Tax=Pestalotiopsis fici (strain W106-1 / CGMCC3.15140) TaxID=1229662 RepID=W3XN08_PESFW|nr:uncharacterized protein PFICI_00494 [Pestalotiopsis fici W106-1]ETS86666.1 hypothetical protein PFICI_00494 [Pestalotiopsis fici W106-1]
MTRFSALVACGLALFQPLALASALLPRDGYQYYTRHNLTVQQVQSELGPLLSQNASIFGPNDTRWENATERYQMYAVPDIKMVVRPGMEDDVAIVVKYANRNSIPFMAKNRGHALTATVGAFSGIQIDMTSLNQINYQPDMKTAWFQGGTYDDQVMVELWDRGYVATTGSCSCVGMMGPGLGGGHGRYQGLYGLISDNLVNLNVVLADGTKLRVNESTNPDLWWAMQGAGHNFGIVTSFELKIYPANIESWYYRNYVFTQEQLEPLFEELNDFHDRGALPGVVGGGYVIYGMNKTVDENKAILFASFIYAGAQADAEPVFERFDKFEYVDRQEGNVPFPQVPDVQGSGLRDPLCAGGKTHITTTAGLQEYNVTAQRQIYELYNQKIAEHPELEATRVVMEGYSVEGVLKHDPKKSSFGHRDDYLTTYFDVENPADYGLQDYALEWAKETRDLWNLGQPEPRRSQPSTYVNYALGDESLEMIYGWEPWRLQKLRALKAKYDPLNTFRYYNPIPPATNHY